jgi:Spy/CpxP family protein refolding chaperone
MRIVHAAVGAALALGCLPATAAEVTVMSGGAVKSAGFAEKKDGSPRPSPRRPIIS